MVLVPDLANQREPIEVWDGLSGKFVRSWRPRHGHRFTLGADPFRNLKAQEAKQGARFNGGLSNSRQSDGGIVILWEHDPSIDKDSDRRNWDSFRVVLTYRNRPATQEEYFEDILWLHSIWAMIYLNRTWMPYIPISLKRICRYFFMTLDLMENKGTT
jgi:hypothetical protein